MKPHRMGPSPFQPVDCPVETKVMRLPSQLAWPVYIRFFVLLLFPIFACPVYGEAGRFEQGLQALKMQNYDAAIHALTIAVEVLPHDFEAYNNRGVAWLGKGDYRRAIADFSKAVKLNPDFAEGFCNRAIARFHTRLWEATLNDSRKALSISPNFFEARCARAAAWTKLKQYKKAIADYTAAFGEKTAAPTNANRRLKDGAISPIESRSSRTPRPHNSRVVVLQLLNKEIREHGIFVHIQNLKASAAESEEVAAPQPVAMNIKPQTVSVPLKKSKFAPKKLNRPVRSTHKAAIPPAKKEATKRRPFTIHISSFQNAAKALEVTLALMQKDDPAAATPVMIPGRGMWFRVLIGFYETRQKAELAAAVLKGRKFHYVKVMKRPWAIALKPLWQDNTQKHLQTTLRKFGFSIYNASRPFSMTSDKILVGAFKSKDEATPFARRLQDAGFKTKVLKR